METALLIVMSLTCILVWIPVVLSVIEHYKFMRGIDKQGRAWKQQVKMDVEQKIREVSGDMNYELGGEIDWSKKA